MELLKAKENLKYTIGDVTFLVRAQATVRDKFELDVAGDWNKDGKFVLNVGTAYRKLVELFVVGWEGVTQDGKPAPYSFDALMGLPADAVSDWILKLGTYIASTTGIIVGEEAKNG